MKRARKALYVPIMFLLIGCLSNIAFANSPPDQPDGPYGIANGQTGVSYSFHVETEDVDGDPIKFTIYWGDGTSDSTDFIVWAVTATASISHMWHITNEMQEFQVYATAEDDKGAVSIQSPPHTVTINAIPKMQKSDTLIDAPACLSETSEYIIIFNENHVPNPEVIEGAKMSFTLGENAISTSLLNDTKLKYGFQGQISPTER